jgi:hypothetical protein
MSKKIATTIEHLIKSDKEPNSGEGHGDAEVDSLKHQVLQDSTTMTQKKIQISAVSVIVQLMNQTP